MIVVVDCNVIVSAGMKDGFVRYVLRSILDRHVILVSAEIMAEYERVAHYPKFTANASAYMLDAIAAIEAGAQVIEPVPCDIGSPDPEDMPYIEAAMAGRADFLITGNVKHFPNGRYGSARVVTVREFAELAGLVP